MGISARRASPDAVLAALVLAHNNSRRAVAFVAAFFHADVTSDTTGSFRNPSVAAAAVASANASNLATSLTLVNEIRQRWIQHRDDDLAHKVADATTVAAPVATDLATAITLANELKGDYNTHIASTTYHYNADSTNGTAATDASDQSSLNTLLNELKADFNAHIASAPAGQSVKLLEA